MDFTNRVVLVTGASRGIGRAIASAFAEAHARVAVHYHQNSEKAAETLTSLPGGGHALYQADIAQPAEAQSLVRAVVEEMGAVDILVNNAGIFEQHPIAGIAYEEWQRSWQRVLGLNLFGPANLTFCVVEHMLARGCGKIVNISSRGAFRGEPDAPAYGASKAGLNALSQSLAQALAPHNIFVHVVAPGFVQTELSRDLLSGPTGESIRRQSPLGRVARPDEVARTVLFLASEGTDFLTGCIVDVNGASYLRS
jgi:NAD(P)-dependent dehydrogenase (short-subunit alcohol dehydrogenase family)